MITNFELESTFHFFQKTLSKKSIFSVYPELLNEIEGYKKLLNKSNIVPNKSYIEYFIIPIKTYIGDDGYSLIWNIDKILKDQKSLMKYKKAIGIDNKSIYSPSLHLNEKKIEQFIRIPKFKKPITLAFHNPIHKWIVIDGNHRFHAAKKRMDSNIDAILLQPKKHCEYLTNDLCINLYRVHHNLFFLINLANAPLLGKYTYSYKLEEKTFYPLITNSCNFSFFKRLQLKFKQIRKNEIQTKQ